MPCRRFQLGSTRITSPPPSTVPAAPPGSPVTSRQRQGTGAQGRKPHQRQALETLLTSHQTPRSQIWSGCWDVTL